MRFDSLQTPLSESDPTGPDLDEAGDDDYLNYMLGADNKIPERYLDPETGAPFDRSRIELAVETRIIAGFLERSRDLRLLALEARFQALAGQLLGFCDCVEAMANLTAAFWDDVHPKGSDGDYTLRQNVVGVLDDRKTVILPLQYAPIVWDQRAGAISLRDFAIATGSAVAAETERKIDINQLNQVMRSETHRAAVDAVHAALTRCRQSTAAIQAVFDERTDYSYSPSFDVLDGILDQLLKFIESARDDLRPATAAPAGPVETAADGAGDGGAGAGTTAARPSATATVRNQAEAAAALLAAETYFGRFEPSSPALLLVHQARLLVGRPLVAALEALAPDAAEYATIVVDATVGFEFSMAKMRSITENYESTAVAAEEDGAPLPDYTALARPEAMALIGGVSAFFRSAEPSSPIPILLSQAERLASQSFHSIIAELLPKRPSA